MGGIESMVRALDGVDPEDPAIPQIRSGGVTTSQVLPGNFRSNLHLLVVYRSLLTD